MRCNGQPGCGSSYCVTCSPRQARAVMDNASMGTIQELRSQLATERARREQAERDRDWARQWATRADAERDAALWSAFVNALRAEMEYARFDEETHKSCDRVIKHGEAVTKLLDAKDRWIARATAAERGRDELLTSNAILQTNGDRLQAEAQQLRTHFGTAEEVTHWRTQAAAMERERNDAQAAELRALKTAERLTIELQAARIPDDVAKTLRDALRLSWLEDDDDGRAAIAWIEGAK